MAAACCLTGRNGTLVISQQQRRLIIQTKRRAVESGGEVGGYLSCTSTGIKTGMLRGGWVGGRWEGGWEIAGYVRGVEEMRQETCFCFNCFNTKIQKSIVKVAVGTFRIMSSSNSFTAVSANPLTFMTYIWNVFSIATLIVCLMHHCYGLGVSVINKRDAKFISLETCFVNISPSPKAGLHQLFLLMQQISTWSQLFTE